MKVLHIAFLALMAIISGAYFFNVLKTSRGNYIPKDVVAKYAEWKRVFGKLYASPAENDHRLSIFHQEHTFVEEQNKYYAHFAKSKGQELWTYV